MADTRRCIICTVSLGLLLFAASCNEGGPPDESPVVDRASAAEEITQADQLYGQRDDLMQLRRGIVALRQAITKDSGSYEAAWKLSKFNYYLAMHTGDTKERDEALRAGIMPARLRSNCRVKSLMVISGWARTTGARPSIPPSRDSQL